MRESPVTVFSRVKGGTGAGKGLLPEDKRWLLHHTEFSEAELERLYTIFKTDYPRGGMFRSQVNITLSGHLSLDVFL